jgi:regulator of sigma E protease
LDKPQNSDRPDAVTQAVDTPLPVAEKAGEPADNGNEPAPPLTPAAWMSQNGPYLVIIAAVVGLIAYKWGLDGLWRAFLVVIGLGFVIFIHELGHFLAAKWCDVHVQTFSIGFGPALPGCSFKYGETVYKIALLPLGGFVNMVGEGTETDEDENYPRSFKNKTVGQRMLIISAGVIMNVLFGCAAFIAVARLHGVPRMMANVSQTEAGSPFWKMGGRSGSRITQIGDVKNPDFSDLKRTVALSPPGAELTIKTEPMAPEGAALDGKVKPRSEKTDPMPVIGVKPGEQLTLYPARVKKDRAIPPLYNSAAAYARAVGVKPGAAVVEASDPDDPEKMTKADGWADVCDRMRRLGDRPLRLRVRSAGGEYETLEIPAAGFDWDDSIVGMTDVGQDRTRYDPFAVTDLPPDESNKEKKAHDYFAYRRRLRTLAGLPVVVQVRRKTEKGDGPVVNLLVPPEYHRSFGMRMRMGEVMAVRDDSPASRAGLEPKDVITRVVMMADVPAVGGVGIAAPLPLLDWQNRDPLRLPFDLSRAAASAPGVKLVFVTVERPNPPGAPQDGNGDSHKASKPVHLGPMVWDSSWDFNDEYPTGSAAALAISQLGIAYRVDSTVVAVDPGSPAERAGLQPNDVIAEVSTRSSGKDRDKVDWDSFVDLKATREDKSDHYDRWATIDLFMQVQADYPDLQLKVTRNGEKIQIPADKCSWMTAEPDRTWPEIERGVLLLPDVRVQKADSMLEAMEFGVGRTVEFIETVFQTIRSLVSGRVSIAELHGPINIARTAFSLADDPFEYTLFLALISVNLAVVNFLPIPILDGGHMMFLVYEKLRGKPASDTVRYWATIAGLLVILALLVFVLVKEAVLPIYKWASR